MSSSVLYIDDDPEDAEIFCEALSHIDGSINCRIATTAKSAIELFNSPCPDFVFLDFHMPVMNGINLLSTLKSHECFSETIVVMYSTHMNEIDIEKCIDLGARYCIAKQGDFDQLLVVLKEIFGKR